MKLDVGDHVMSGAERDELNRDHREKCDTRRGDGALDSESREVDFGGDRFVEVLGTGGIELEVIKRGFPAWNFPIE